MQVTVGIDLGYEQHQVCILALDGSCLEEFAMGHTGQAIDEAIAAMLRHVDGDPTRLVAALEAPHGAVVDALLEHDLSVYAINPKQLDRFRDRHCPSGAKDDRRDALVLADAVRTDRLKFRLVSSQDPAIIQLRELVSMDSELVTDSGRQANRLRSVLHRYYTQILTLCPSADEAWIWDLIELAPTPTKAARLRTSTIQQLLKRYRIRRLTADAVQTVLRDQAVRAPAATVEAAAGHVGLLVTRLQLLHRQRQQVQKQIRMALKAFENEPGQESEHRDLEILLSVPGLGTKTAATMLVEAPLLLQSRDYHTLRILAGLAPITRASGKSRMVCMRHACNPRLRNACHMWGMASLGTDPLARAYYHQQRSRGHGHARALRSLVDRQLQMVMAMLREGTLYDADRRQPAAEQPRAA